MNKLKPKVILCILGVVLTILILSQIVLAEDRVSDFELKIEEPKIIETAPGETANFTAKVKNNGNLLENFTIAIDKEEMPEGLPDGWKIEFLPKDFNISAGNEKTVNVNITSNVSSDFGDYKIYINVTSLDNISAPASVDNCTVRISFYKPDIIGDPHLDTYTGNFVHYEELNLSLKNRGSAKDVISADIKYVDSPLIANWAGAVPEELLESNEASGNYVLRVRIPENTPYSSEKDYEIQLYVNSSKDSSKNEIVKITVFVDKYYNMSVNLPNGSSDEVDFRNGYQTEFDIEIKNEGNLKTDFILEYVNGLPENWNSIPDGTGIVIKDLESNYTTHYFIIIDVDKEALKGIYENISFKLKPKDSSIPELNIELEVEVMKFFDVVVTKEQNLIVEPGSTYYVNFTVKNLGNERDRYLISMEGQIDHVTLVSPPSFPLDVGEIDNITIKIITPEEPSEREWFVNITTQSSEFVGVKATSYLNITIRPYYKPTLVGTNFDDADTDGYVTTYHSFYLQLRNDGTAEDTLNMSIIDTEYPLNARWNGLPPYGVQLDPFSETGAISEPYELEIEIPKLTPYKMYNIALWVHSAMGKGKKADLKLEINKYFEVSMSIVGPETIPVYLNETSPKAEFTVNITNKGNTNMDLKLIYSGGLPDTKWKSTPDGDGNEFLGVEPKEYRLETIIIEPDDEAEVEIYSNIKFKLFPTEDESTFKEISLSVEIKEYREILLKKVGGSYNVKPTSGNEKVGIPFDITNDGNVDDTVRLEVLNSFYETYPNATRWEVNFYSDKELTIKITSIYVPANSGVTVYLGVKIPTSVDEICYVPPDLYSIPIYGESSKESNVNSQVDLSLIIDSINEVHLEYTGGTKKADAGETITFEVKVENYGNAADIMTFDLVDENKWVHPLDEIYKEEFDGGEKRTIKVNLTVPTIAEDDDAVAGNYDIELRVKPTTGGTQQKITLPFKIKETYGCDIEIIDKYKKETMPEFGTVIKFKFKVTNLGNSETENEIRIPGIDAIYNLSGSDFNKWDVRFQLGVSPAKEELTLYIDPLESEEVTLSIDTRPYGGFEDYYGIEIRAYPLGHLEDEAESKMIWLNLTEPIYKLRWTEGSKNQYKIVEPKNGTEVEYTVYVENLGTEDDYITVKVEALAGWIELGWDIKFKTWSGEEVDTINYEVHHGDIQTITVVVRPYEFADPAFYIIELIVESQLESTATDKLTIYTQVKRPDLVIYAKDIILPEKVKEGDLAQIKVVVHNIGDADVRDAEIKFYTNKYMEEEIDNKTITIPAYGNATVTCDWKINIGKYNITVVADEKNKIIESNEDNNKATAQSIEIGQSGYIKESTVVITSIFDGAIIDKNQKSILIKGTASDEITIQIKVQIKIDDGKWQDVEGTNNWTYEWDLTDVKEGNHTISVRSIDGGNSYSEIETINVTVEKGVAGKDEKSEEGLKIIYVIPIIAIMLVIGIIIGYVVFQRKAPKPKTPTVQQPKIQQQYQPQQVIQKPQIQPPPQQFPPKQPPSFSSHSYQTTQKQWQQTQQIPQPLTTNIPQEHNKESEIEEPVFETTPKEEVMWKQIEDEQVSTSLEEMTKAEIEPISEDSEKISVVDESTIESRDMQELNEIEEIPKDIEETIEESGEDDWWENWEKSMKLKKNIDEDK